MNIENPVRFSRRIKSPVYCPKCGQPTHITKAGKWYRHRMPPKNYGYNMPLRAGPICKASGSPFRAAGHTVKE